MNMLLSPNDIIKKGIISGFLDEDVQKQPNGVDLTIGKLQSILGDGGEIDFTNENRHFPTYEDIELPAKIQPDSYLVQFAETIRIPKNMFGYFMVRSSLQRMGEMIFSSGWDSGYEGKGTGLLLATRPVIIDERARVGQLVFWKAKSAKLYEGIHQKEGLKK